MFPYAACCVVACGCGAAGTSKSMQLVVPAPQVSSVSAGTYEAPDMLEYSFLESGDLQVDVAGQSMLVML